MSMEPILDEHIKVCEKDLGEDECEIEMRTNLVVTLLMSVGYCYLRLHFYSEALKCFDYALELAPIAADAYLRRSQCRMYNRLSSIAELRLAMDDANKAIERRPKDKLYLKHKELLEQTMVSQISKEVAFVTKLVDKANAQLEIKERIAYMRRARLQEEGLMDEQEEEKVPAKQEEPEPELKYPEECRVLDIMRQKYHEAVRFFTDTNDKQQQIIAVKEFQRFAYFYHEKMLKYISFDPLAIEEDVYQRLSEDVKMALSNKQVLQQILIICNRKASDILEDDEVHVLNFQMFQYAMKIF